MQEGCVNLRKIQKTLGVGQIFFVQKRRMLFDRRFLQDGHMDSASSFVEPSELLGPVDEVYNVNLTGTRVFNLKR